MSWYFTFHAKDKDAAEHALGDVNVTGDMPNAIREAILCAIDTAAEEMLTTKMLHVSAAGHTGPDASINITVRTLDAPLAL